VDDSDYDEEVEKPYQFKSKHREEDDMTIMDRISFVSVVVTIRLGRRNKIKWRIIKLT
jgi:hypothetical protein